MPLRVLIGWLRGGTGPFMDELHLKSRRKDRTSTLICPLPRAARGINWNCTGMLDAFHYICDRLHTCMAGTEGPVGSQPWHLDGTGRSKSTYAQIGRSCASMETIKMYTWKLWRNSVMCRQDLVVRFELELIFWLSVAKKNLSLRNSIRLKSIHLDRSRHWEMIGNLEKYSFK